MTASTPSCWAIPCATWRQLPVPSPLLAEIKALTRDRDRLLETQRAVESQLRMILEAYRPAPVRLFSSVDRQITLHFVTTPQPNPGRRLAGQDCSSLPRSPKSAERLPPRPL
jgi:hypothetical protein